MGKLDEIFQTMFEHGSSFSVGRKIRILSESTGIEIGGVYAIKRVRNKNAYVMVQGLREGHHYGIRFSWFEWGWVKWA